MTRLAYRFFAVWQLTPIRGSKGGRPTRLADEPHVAGANVTEHRGGHLGRYPARVSLRDKERVVRPTGPAALRQMAAASRTRVSRPHRDHPSRRSFRNQRTSSLLTRSLPLTDLDLVLDSAGRSNLAGFLLHFRGDSRRTAGRTRTPARLLDVGAQAVGALVCVRWPWPGFHHQAQGRTYCHGADSEL
jgi:hypothetical protein